METKEEKQLKLDKRYIRMASIWAENSYCERRQVGALIVKDKMIISDGYNGTPAGFENVCEDDNGVTKPYVCLLYTSVLAISDVGMATSGNYRNFYYKGGKKYAHTIDPRTGYPVQHSILSSTVIAKDCASADAYATAFMVMGLDSAKAFCEAHPELDAYFICSGEGDKYETYFTDGMKKFIINEK